MISAMIGPMTAASLKAATTTQIELASSSLNLSESSIDEVSLTQSLNPGGRFGCLGSALTFRVIHGLANCSDQVVSIAAPRKPRENGWSRCFLQLPEEGGLAANPRQSTRECVGVPRRN